MINIILSFFGHVLITEKEYKEHHITIRELANDLAKMRSDSKHLALVCDEQRYYISRLQAKVRAL